MSEQVLSLNDWEEVKEAFRDHFKSGNVETRSDVIEYSRGNEFLKVEKDGKVSGAMTLHEVSLSEIEEIVFRASEIELKSTKESYIFRR